MQSMKARMVYALSATSITGAFSIIVKIYVNALFLTEYSSSDIPMFFLLQALSLLLFTLLFKRGLSVNTKWSTVILNILIPLFLCGTFYILLFHNFHWMPFIFCVVLTDLMQMLVSTNQTHLSKIFDVREYKLIYNHIPAYTVVGGVVVGSLTPWLIDHFGLNFLMVPLLILPVINSWLHYKLDLLPDDNVHKIRRKDLKLYSLLKYIFVGYVLIVLVSKDAAYLFMHELGQNLSTDKIATYSAAFYVVVSVVAFVISLAGINKIITRFGIIMLIYIAYTLIFASAVSTTMFASLTMVMILAGLEQAFFPAYVSKAQSLFTNVLPDAVVMEGKVFINTIVDPISVILVSALLFLLGSYATTPIIAAIIAVTAVVIIIISRYTNKAYFHTLEEYVHDKNLAVNFEHLDEKSKLRVINLATRFAKSDDEKSVMTALALMSKLGITELPDVFLQLVFHSKKDIRIIALKYIERNRYMNALPFLLEQLEEETEPEVIWRLLRSIAYFDPKTVVPFALVNIDNPIMEIKAGSIVVLLAGGHLTELLLALQQLTKLLHSEDKMARVWGGRILIFVKGGKLEDDVINLLRDSDAAVVREGLKVVTNLSLTSRSLIDVVVERLSDARLAYSASMALQKLGKVVLPSLGEAISRGNYLTKYFGLKTLLLIPGEESETLVKAYAEDPDIRLENMIAKSSAYRKESMGVCPQFAAFALQESLKEATKIKLLRYFIKTKHKDVAIKKELISREHYAKERYLYWLLITLRDNNLMSSMPTVLSTDDANKQLRAKAIEYLEVATDSVELRQSIHDVFESSLVEIEEEEASHYRDYLDPWICGLLEIKKPGANVSELENIVVLRNVEIFKDLPSESLLAIANETEHKNMATNQLIFKSGDSPDGMYIILSGTVDITIKDKVVSSLKESDFFGELGLIDHRPRVATAMATSDASLLFLSQATFDQLTDFQPEILKSVTKVIIKYLRDNLTKMSGK